MKAMIESHTRGQALCPICTHTVPAEVDLKGKLKFARVSPGQRCPRCGASLTAGAGITVEFWQGADRIFHTWCGGCHWTGDITPVTDMIGHEPDH